MFLGRLCGWMMVGLAVLMASGDAVMAFGPGDYVGIATADLWTLLAGSSPGDGQAAPPLSLAAVAAALMDLPAWMVVGPLGAGLVLLCRRRQRHRAYRRTAA